jgi:predicted nucleotidyltransferase component of viral defense system
MLEKTRQVLDVLAQNEFFGRHDVRFVGGTALSYLINHRLSEDLDFAMLELPKDEINRLMRSFGAEEIAHSDTAVDYALNEGGDLYDCHLKYILDGIKVEFFTPPFNTLEKEIWTTEATSHYENTSLKIASFETIMYMKSMAFWNRKKYRDLFDIYYVITNIDGYKAKDFVENYLKYNITYTKKALYEKIKSKSEFYERLTDEGISALVANPKPYEWYRRELEGMLYAVYLDELYG